MRYVNGANKPRTNPFISNATTRTVQTITSVSDGTGGSVTDKRQLELFRDSGSGLTTQYIAIRMPFDCYLDTLDFTVANAPNGAGKKWICRFESKIDKLAFNSDITQTIASDIEFIEAVIENAETNAVSNPDAALFLAKGDSLVQSIIPVGTFATGTITVLNVIATDQVTVNGLTYTAVNGEPATSREFSADGTDTQVALALANSINTDDTTAGKTVADVDVECTASSNVITLTATHGGTVCNSIDITTPDATITPSGATLTGGADPDAHGAITTTIKLVSPEGKQLVVSSFGNQHATLECTVPMENHNGTAFSTTLGTHDFTAVADGEISDINVTRDNALTGGQTITNTIYNISSGLSIAQVADATPDGTVNTNIRFYNGDTEDTLAVTAGQTLRFTNLLAGGAGVRFGRVAYAFKPTDSLEDFSTGAAPNSISTEGPITNVSLNSSIINLRTTTCTINMQVRDHRNDYQLQVASDAGFSTIVFTSPVTSSIAYDGGKGLVKINMVVFNVTGLTQDVRYWYRIVSNSTPDTDYVGNFYTLPAITAPASPVEDLIYWYGCLDLREDGQEIGTDRYNILPYQKMADTQSRLLISLGDDLYPNNPSTSIEPHSKPRVALRNHPVIKSCLKNVAKVYAVSDHDHAGLGGDTNLNEANPAYGVSYPDADQAAPFAMTAIENMLGLWDEEVTQGAGYLRMMSVSLDIRRTRHIVWDTQNSRYKPNTMLGDGTAQTGTNHTTTATPNQVQWIKDRINACAADGIKLCVLYGGGAKPNNTDGFHTVGGWLDEFTEIGDTIREAEVECIFIHSDLHHSGASAQSSTEGGPMRDTENGLRVGVFCCSPLLDSIIDGSSAWNQWDDPTKNEGSLERDKYATLKVTDDAGYTELDYTVENRDSYGNLLYNFFSTNPCQWSNRDIDRELNFTAGTDSVSSGDGTYSLRVLKSWLGEGRFHVTSTGTGSTLINSDYETLPNKKWLDIPITLTGDGTTTFTITAHSVNATNNTIGATDELVLTIS